MSDPVKDSIISEGRRIADHTWDTMWEERGGPYPLEQGDTSALAYKAATERWADLQRQYLPDNNATRTTTTEDIVALMGLLDGLRWKEDMVVTNHFGERVWLTPAYDDKGQRIGITDCCLEEAPCQRHSH